MKKILLASIGLLVIGSVIYAVTTTNNVDDIVTKNTTEEAKLSERTVSASDFNSIVGTIKGIFNDGTSIGLNTIPPPVSGFDLTVAGGALRTAPLTTEISCNSTNKGMIYFDTRYFIGCDGINWRQLNGITCP